MSTAARHRVGGFGAASLPHRSAFGRSGSTKLAGVRQRVRDADAAMAALHQAATDELKARRPGRSVRHQFRKAAAE